MKHFKLLMLGFGLVLTLVLVVQPAQASRTYHRTPTTAIRHQTYYTTNSTSHTFKANGNYNRWTFKANHNLKNYRNTAWTATQKTYITKNGKRCLYYWVHNGANGASGWIWHGFLKPIKNSQAAMVSQLNVARNARQIVTVVQSGKSTATLRLWEKNRGLSWRNTLTASSRIGGSGIGYSREGSSRTPIGTYHLSFAFGKAAHVRTNGIGYRQIQKNSYWIEDLKDRQYNTWQNRKWANNKNEHLIDYTKAAPRNQYQLAVVMDNHGQNNGSGFFIHVRNQWATQGCVSISLGNMQKLVSKLSTRAYVTNVQYATQLLNY
ncbi:L,D-transpeptidase family protein [Lactiplantibacillus pentosus]|nr:L,D-transpeptidase family protein [Lactiplantibacillus pentosus]MCJ8180123.1 L,D-transpeptidase family protein [Lactiplantibacillus pentosus]